MLDKTKLQSKNKRVHNVSVQHASTIYRGGIQLSVELNIIAVNHYLSRNDE